MKTDKKTSEQTPIIVKRGFDDLLALKPRPPQTTSKHKIKEQPQPEKKNNASALDVSPFNLFT